MHIAMIISNPFPPEEGIGHYTYNLSKKLMERGHEVTIFTRGSFKTEIKFYEGIRVIEAAFIPFYPFHVHIHGYFLNKIYKKLENEFDLVHIHTPLTPLIKTSLPIVTTIHGSMIGNAIDLEIVDLKSLGTKVLTKYLSFPLVSKLIKSSDKVTTVSESVKQELEDYYSLSNVIVTETSVDERKFFPTNNEGQYILYVGRLSYGKGLFDLIEIAKKINEKHDIKFYLVGKGELEKALQEKIQKENLKDYVKILGQIEHDQLVQMYQKAIFFIFPSYYEGFPTVVLEAMSSGLPVLASDIDAHKYFIDNFKNGILIKKGSIEDATEKIEILLNNENLRKELGKNARKTVEEKYTSDIIIQKFQKIYESLL